MGLVRGACARADSCARLSCASATRATRARREGRRRWRSGRGAHSFFSGREVKVSRARLKKMMRRLLFTFLCLCCFAVASNAQDIVGGLEPIGAITSFSKRGEAVTFSCQDGSQVRLYLLAPDLVRVRASFKK